MSKNIEIKPLPSTDIETVANWYNEEWNIDKSFCLQCFSDYPNDIVQCQLGLYLNGEIVATGGLHQKVGINKRTHQYDSVKLWLALLFTSENHRGNGFASLLIKELENLAKTAGHTVLHLYTHSAPELYFKNNYSEIATHHFESKNVRVMNKKL